MIMDGEVTISEFIDCFRGLTAILCGALATSGAVWSFGLAECLACSLVVPHGVAMSVLAYERCSLVFGLAACLACKLVVQAVQSWSSALLRACTDWGSPLGASRRSMWCIGFRAVQFGRSALLCAWPADWKCKRCSHGLRPCCVLVQAGAPPHGNLKFCPVVCGWSGVCVCVVCLCVCVVCGRPDTSGCWGSCWVLMCLRACHPAVAPVACEVWGLDRAGCCRVVLVCVCVAFGANTDGESHKCGTAADSRGEVR